MVASFWRAWFGGLWSLGMSGGLLLYALFRNGRNICGESLLLNCKCPYIFSDGVYFLFSNLFRLKSDFQPFPRLVRWVSASRRNLEMIFRWCSVVWYNHVHVSASLF